MALVGCIMLHADDKGKGCRIDTLHVTLLNDQCIQWLVSNICPVSAVGNGGQPWVNHLVYLVV